MSTHPVLPATALVPITLPPHPHPPEHLVFYPFRTLEILNLVLNLARVLRRRPLVEGAQEIAANGERLIPATGHQRYQISLGSTNSICSPVMPGGLTSHNRQGEVAPETLGFLVPLPELLRSLSPLQSVEPIPRPELERWKGTSHPRYLRGRNSYA